MALEKSPIPSLSKSGIVFQHDLFPNGDQIPNWDNFKKEVKDAVKQRGYPETMAEAITFRAGVELPEDIGAIRTGLDTFAKKFPPQSEIPTEPVR